MVETTDLRLIVLYEGGAMNDDAMIFKTNVPEKRLKALEDVCQALLKDGRDVEDLPIWSDVLKKDGYVFDFVEDNPNYLPSEKVDNVTEKYYLEGEE